MSWIAPRKRLDGIQRLLDDIHGSRDPDEMLPEHFLEVWEAVWANRAVSSDEG